MDVKFTVDGKDAQNGQLPDKIQQKSQSSPDKNQSVLCAKKIGKRGSSSKKLSETGNKGQTIIEKMPVNVGLGVNAEKQQSQQSEVPSPLSNDQDQKNNNGSAAQDTSSTKEKKEDIDRNTKDKKLQSQQLRCNSNLKHAERDLRKLQQSEVYSHHYIFQKVLGEGAFCTVYQAVDLETQETIAVKVIKRKDVFQNSIDLLRQEAELLQSMDHPNIVRFKHIKEIKGKIFLGMELMQDKLSQLIDRRKKFTDEEASQIIKCIFEAVEYLHNNNIVHRDLKPDNILIGDPNDLSTIKIADFGLSAKYEHESYWSMDQQVGTLIFMGPELVLKKRYSRGVDVFATGIIMYMLLTGGDHPLYNSKDFQVEKYKKQLLELHQFSFPSHLSPLAKNIFLRLTKFNITMRYTASEALRHPWITRLNKTLIPMTLQDKIENMEIERNFRSKIGMMIFMSNVSDAQSYFENNEFKEYKNLLSRVTRKIEKWHDKFGSMKIQKKFFAKDEEFIELDNSPTKFETSSEEEEDQDEETDSPSQLENFSKRNTSDMEIRMEGKSYAPHNSELNSQIPGDQTSTIVTNTKTQNSESPKLRKGSFQTRDFKLRLEHANIHQNRAKNKFNEKDEEQLITFTEDKSSGLKKHSNLLGSAANQSSPRRKSVYKKQKAGNNPNDQQLKMQNQLQKTAVQASLNSITQVTNAVNEQSNNRNRKNSRNPIIKKDDIIANDSNCWNHPSPGIAQGVTATNSLGVSGVASRYGDNSNSLINEQLRQQDLKAMQARVATEQQTIEDEDCTSKPYQQETSRFASGRKAIDGNFRVEVRTEKNRRSEIQTNANDEKYSQLQELCKSYNQEQYQKQKTMNEKKQSLSNPSDSRISESLTSKEDSKANIGEESGSGCENNMGIQYRQTDLTHQESQGNNLIPMKNQLENLMSPFEQSPMISRDLGQGALEKHFTDDMKTQQEVNNQIDLRNRQHLVEHHCASVSNSIPDGLYEDQSFDHRHNTAQGNESYFTQPRIMNKGKRLSNKHPNQELIGVYLENQSNHIMNSPKAPKKFKNKSAKKGQSAGKEGNKMFPQSNYQTQTQNGQMYDFNGHQRANNQQKNHTFSDISQQQPLLAGQQNVLSQTKRFERFSDPIGVNSGQINFQERQPFSYALTQPSTTNRVEAQKRNDVYDQKFLFKKNFISKYQPGTTIQAPHKTVNQQYKMIQNNQFSQNNDILYKGTHDNYQTGIGTPIFNTPNYTINRKSQGFITNSQRGYMENQKSIDGSQRPSDPHSRQISAATTIQPFKTPFQKNNFESTEECNNISINNSMVHERQISQGTETSTSKLPLDTGGSDLQLGQQRPPIRQRFSDTHQVQNQQNLPEILEGQYQSPQKFQRTVKPNKANSAKHTRDLKESADHFNSGRLLDSRSIEFKTPNRISIPNVNGSIQDNNEKSPASHQLQSRPPNTNQNMPVQLNFSSQAAGFFQPVQNQKIGSAPYKKSMTHIEKQPFTYIQNTEHSFVGNQSSIMDEQNLISQTQKIDQIGVVSSSPRSKPLMNKKGANSDIRVNRIHGRQSNKKLHTQSQNHSSLFPDEFEKTSQEYQQQHQNYPVQFRATYPNAQNPQPRPYQNDPNGGYATNDPNLRQSDPLGAGTGNFNRVKAYIKIQNMPSSALLTQQQKPGLAPSPPSLHQDQHINSQTNLKINQQSQMMTNSGKPISYGNKITNYPSQNQNRQMRVGQVNFVGFNAGNLPQNNGFNQTMQPNALMQQTQPISMPIQQQTQQQINAQYNSRHSFTGNQLANNLAQPNLGRIGVRGFLDPTVGVTGIGINHQIAHQGGFANNSQIHDQYRGSNPQAQNKTMFQNKNQEDSQLALDIEMGIIGSIQEKAYRQHQSNSSEVNAYRAQYNNQNAYMTQNQHMNKKQHTDQNGSFGRQNSDQTAYMRNARAIVQNHNQGMHKGNILFVQCRRITSSSQQVRHPT